MRLLVLALIAAAAPAPKTAPAPTSAPAPKTAPGPKASPAPKKTVTLSFRATPGMRVVAIWLRGKNACDTPCELKVPFKAHVQVTYSADGYLSSTENVFANEDKLLEPSVRDLPVYAPF